MPKKTPSSTSTQGSSTTAPATVVGRDRAMDALNKIRRRDSELLKRLAK